MAQIKLVRSFFRLCLRRNLFASRNLTTSPVLSSGALLQALNHKGPVVVNHPEDNERDKYYQVLKSLVVPTCSQLSEAYMDNIAQMVEYTTPAFHDCWNFGVELVYRKLCPTQTDLTQIRILRISLDLMFAMSAVLDDISDKSNMRRGKPSWSVAAPGGWSQAIYDGGLLGYLPYHLISTFLRDSPHYTSILETFTKANIAVMIGQALDVLEQGRSPPSIERYNNAALHKAGKFVQLQPTLAILLAGNVKASNIPIMEAIFNRMGQCFQIWDDFCDYYRLQEDTGKPNCDFVNAGNTWLSATAFELFTKSQRDLFLECYGSREEEKIALVRGLYKEVDMPGRYEAKMELEKIKIGKMIATVPDDRLRVAADSFLTWLLG